MASNGGYAAGFTDDKDRNRTSISKIPMNRPAMIPWQINIDMQR